jgi:hypothetical protein
MARRLSSFSTGMSRGRYSWCERLLCFVFLFIAFHFVCPLERSWSRRRAMTRGRTTHTRRSRGRWHQKYVSTRSPFFRSRKTQSQDAAGLYPAWKISSSKRSFPLFNHPAALLSLKRPVRRCNDCSGVCPFKAHIICYLAAQNAGSRAARGSVSIRPSLRWKSSVHRARRPVRRR